MTRRPVVLLTGATGFIGSHLATTLARQGINGGRCQLRFLVRKTSNRNALAGIHGSFYEGDLLVPHSLIPAVKSADFIFHLAAQTATRLTDLDCNVKGTKNLAEVVLKHSPDHQRLIFLSSLAASGPSHDHHLMTESDLPRPITEYGQSKLAGESILYQSRNDLRTTIIRSPAVYGPRDKELFPLFRMIKGGLMLIPGRGDDYLSVVYVNNLVHGLIQAATHPQTVDETFFIADSEITTKAALFQTIAEIFRSRPLKITIPRPVSTLLGCFQPLAPYRIQAVRSLFARRWLCSTKKAEDIFNFQPPHSQQEGLKETINWYLEQGWL